MRIVYLLLIIVLVVGGAGAQNLPAPTPQPLASPTAFQTPTSVSPTTDVNQNLALTQAWTGLSTAEAELQAPMQVQAPEQIQYLANAFGVIQYMFRNDRALFGVFAPLFQFLVYLTPVVIILLLAYVGNLIVSTIYAIVSDIFQKIRG